jgi:hypothetical protein
MICTVCEDSGWVCENHPYLPWGRARTLANAAALACLAPDAIRAMPKYRRDCRKALSVMTLNRGAKAVAN